MPFTDPSKKPPPVNGNKRFEILKGRFKNHQFYRSITVHRYIHRYCVFNAYITALNVPNNWLYETSLNIPQGFLMRYCEIVDAKKVLEPSSEGLRFPLAWVSFDFLCDKDSSKWTLEALCPKFQRELAQIEWTTELQGSKYYFTPNLFITLELKVVPSLVRELSQLCANTPV